MFKVLLLCMCMPFLASAKEVVVVAGPPTIVSAPAELPGEDACVVDPCPDAGLASVLPSEAPSVAPSVAPSAPAPESVPSVGKLLVDGGKAVEAIKIAESSGTVVKIATALSVVLFFLINVLKKYGPVVLSGNHIRVIAVIAGAVAACAGYIGAGLPWEQMLQLFLAGPGALAFNETMKFFRKPDSGQ